MRLAIKKTVGFMVAALLFAVAIPAHAQMPQNPERLLDALLEDYKSYGLPFPPKEAKLALIQPPPLEIGSFNDNSKEWAKIAVFLLPHTQRGKAVVAVPLSNLRVKIPKRWNVFREPSNIAEYETADTDNYWISSAVAGKSVTPMPPFIYPEFREDVHLIVMAIVCHQRGQASLANLFLKRTNPNKYPDYDLRKAFAEMAWSYWIDAFIDDRADRATVANHLSLLLRVLPDHSNRLSIQFIASLKLPVKRTHTSGDKVEGLLDRLVVCKPSTLAEHDKNSEDISGISPYYTELWKLGFDAVPTLIKHINDDRLTRFEYWTPGYGGNVPHVPSMYSVSDISEDILRTLSGLEKLSQKDVEAWWKNAQEVDEEESLMQRSLYVKDGKMTSNPHILHLIKWKYPERLAELYETMLTKYPLGDKSLIGKLLAARCPDDKRAADLLIQATKSPNLEQSKTAFWALMQTHDSRFAPLLIDRMNPVSSNGGGESRLDYEFVSNLARYDDDRRLWNALETLAYSLHSTQRVEMLGRLLWFGIEGKKWLHAHQFIARFLNDTTTIEPSEPNKSYHLKVCDIAAEYIAGFLGIEIHVTDSWTEKEWTLLRERVREALKRKRL
ncbi:MAG: hypothetical protein NT023_22460 [Armatimonadetes bacterium]|nr:hypothetical protein [Armatimonadota bacterium]